MNVTTSKPNNSLHYTQVKMKKPTYINDIPSKINTIPTKKTAIPSTIPNYAINQSRKIRTANNKKRFSLPPSIKEEGGEEEEEENIPLAILAYRKGFDTPTNIIPFKRYSDPSPHTMKNNRLIPHQFYQLTNYSSSSSSLSSTEFIPKTQQSRPEPKFYRRHK